MKSTLLSLSLLLVSTLLFSQKQFIPTRSESYFSNRISFTNKVILSHTPGNTRIPLTLINYIADQYEKKLTGRSVIKQRLDSIYQYFIDIPELKSKQHIRYNDAGQEISHSHTTWDDARAAYVNDFKTESSYDAQGKLLAVTGYTGDNLLWLPSFKREYAYNGKNQLVTYSEFNWDEFLQAWVVSMKTEIKYDSRDLAIEATNYQWNTGTNSWDQFAKAELEYDSHFNNTVTTFYFWDNQWLPDGRDEIIYNSLNQELSYISLIWDETAADWVNKFKFLSEYNSKNFQTKASSFTWDASNNIWVPSNKTDYSYDMNDNMWQSISYFWDDATQKLEILFKEECEYTNQYSFDDLILPFSIGAEPEIYCHHMLNRIKEFSYNSGNWHNDVNNEYYYSAINITSVSNQNEIISKIIPNPAQDHILIEIPELLTQADFRLYDVNGSLLHSQKISKKDKISIHQFAPGIYLYKLISDQNSIGSGKLIIE